MAFSFISRAIVCFIFCAPAVLSVPGIGSSALERRLPPISNPGTTCPPPLILCDRACCSTDSVCGPTGLCKAKPPSVPPVPGQLSLRYSNDNLGRTCVINIHGQGFNTTVDLKIEMVVGTETSDVWTDLHLGAHTFDINNGFQDCSKTGKRTSASDGYPAYVYASDASYIAYTGVFEYTSAIPVRVTANGICP